MEKMEGLPILEVDAETLMKAYFGQGYKGFDASNNAIGMSCAISPKRIADALAVKETVSLPPKSRMEKAVPWVVYLHNDLNNETTIIACFHDSADANAFVLRHIPINCHHFQVMQGWPEE